MDIFILISVFTCMLTIVWLDYKFGEITVPEALAWIKQKIAGEK